MVAAALESERGALDALAHDLLRSIADLDFRVATSAAEIDAALRLRYEAVIENGWADPADYPDGRESDADDARATQIVCLDGARVVGCLRLVRRMPETLLPTERDFDLRLPPEEEVADAGRIVVAPSHRGVVGQLVLTGLVARGWLEARSWGVTRIVGAAEARTTGRYEELGLRIAVLGPGRTYWGEQRQPIEIVGANRRPDVPGATAGGEEDRWADPAAGRSRRSMLAGAAAGTLALLGLPEVAAAAGGGRVGEGPTDRRTIDFIARIEQVGTSLVGLGYLTRVAGLPLSTLFTRTPAKSTADPGATDTSVARFAFVMQAQMEAIAALGASITGQGQGSSTIHFLPDGGASLDDPATLGAGTVVATFSFPFQHTLAIDAPDHALGNFSADLTQRSARVFAFGGGRYQLCKPGLPWSLKASGRGTRTDPTTPKSEHFIAGDMGVIDAVAKG